MSDGVTCAWCHGDVGFGESHGDGVCVVSVPFEVDTTRIDAALDRMRVFARGQLGNLPVDPPAPELRLSADTPLVSRSPHVPSGSTGYVLDGSMFADDRLRVVLAESAPSEIVEAVREQLEQWARQADLLEWVSRVMSVHPDGAPKPPAPVLFPWQARILAAVRSGERLTIAPHSRSHGRSFVDRVLSEVCSACRTVGGHAPTCVTHVEAQLRALTSTEKEI